MDMYDVIIIGGGPAGLSAALNFGRGLKRALVIDEDKPRNRVTEESNGYLTHDGISLLEFRKLAQKDALKYEGVSLERDRVMNVEKQDGHFIVSTSTDAFESRQVLLAAGLREKQPDIENFEQFYGISIFYCPWCDGYELRNRPLAVMVDQDTIGHLVMLISNWSRDLLFCTNGADVLTDAHRKMFENKGFKYNEAVISELSGAGGQVETITFENGTEAQIKGMIARMHWDTDFDFLEGLDLKREDNGKFTVDSFSETSMEGLYVAGETKNNFAGQLIDAASDGGMVAKYMMMKQIQAGF
ncbi:NAD(P)/FAD-dependent oxidoreductase [Salinicoccus sp. ID82-1]|nr:NAD(P)/FAD-dependent oxidoreductase [Salinicoccus sp. ID82-1]